MSTADTGKPRAGKPGRPYGRHPALVTADRLLDASEWWAWLLSSEEMDAIGKARTALLRIGGVLASGSQPLAPCGTEAAYRNGEPDDDACRAAHAAAKRTERSSGQTTTTPPST